MMKTRQDNDVIDHTGVVYAKNDIELLWAINQVQSVAKTIQDDSCPIGVSADSCLAGAPWLRE